jgi:DNA-binding response OmpR family regulator
VKTLVVHQAADPRHALERELLGMGHECRVAENTGDAMALIGHYDVDLVIADGDSGDDLRERIKARKPAPYFILHSPRDPESALEAIDAGADEYIMKPFDTDIMRSKLAQVGLL